MNNSENRIASFSLSAKCKNSEKVYPQSELLKLNLENEEKTCRICLETEVCSEKFIRPCKCSGSVKFVHEECLKSWLVSLNKDLDGSKCEICSTQYKMNFIIKRKCLPKESCKNGGGHCFFIPILSTVIVMLAIIIYLLAKRYFNKQSTTEQKSYTIALTILCSIAAFIMFALIFNSLKEVCLIAKMDSWKILSQVFDEEIEVNAEGLNKFEEIRNLPMIIPKKTMIKGKKVKVPELRPMLTPVSRRNRVVAFSPKYYTPVHSKVEKSSFDNKMEKVFKY